MDPLSVAASVVGLLIAAGKMAQSLKQLTSLADAPSSAKAVLTEMSDMAAALEHLQDYLNGTTSVPAGRGQFILLEHVVVTLTGCVTTYSELELIIDSVHVDPEMGAFDRIKWAVKEKEILDIVRRIQNHKSSLTLMLTILQCKSNQEAENSMARLCSLIERVARSNENLSSRLHRLEGRQLSPDAGNPPSVLGDDSSTIRPAINNRTDQVSITAATRSVRFSFEETLQSSRVYLRSMFRHSESSLSSSVQRAAAISMFSSLSLADVSNISVFSLPIYAIDISNSYWYTFDLGGTQQNSQLQEVQSLSGDREVAASVKALTRETTTVGVPPVDVWWVEQRIEATVTRDFVFANLQEEEQKFLDEPLVFGGGLTDDTYIEWILKKAKRIFLILKELGVTDRIRLIADDSWDDSDLPLPLEAIKRLQLTYSRDGALEKRFYKMQFKFLLQEIKEGEHIVFGTDEFIPIEPVNKRSGFTFDYTAEKVHLPGRPGEIYKRRRIVLSGAPDKAPEEDFIAKIQVMKSAVHPHIAPWASYTYRGYGYILLKSVSDVSLKDFIRFTPQQFKILRERERQLTLLTWLHCLANALAFLYRHGLTHENIKPSNIMIDESNNIFFTDILAFKWGDADKEASGIESYEYGAPERWGRTWVISKPSLTKHRSGGEASWKRNSDTSTSSGPSISTNTYSSNPPTEPSVVYIDWQNNTPDFQKSDVFSLGCIWLDIMTILLKRKSTSFSSHRSAKNKKPGIGGGLPDMSFHANIGQLESWIGLLKRDASKKEDRIFRFVPSILALTQSMLSRDPNIRPRPHECEELLHRVLASALFPEITHCDTQQLAEGDWEFGSPSSAEGSDTISTPRQSAVSSFITKRLFV
ncbi:hypothetical protein FGG08_004543 [Glutinoglossum americanum]|uniref:Protein kinase domain-containing protein n=1 Tax=Glutinoglossum americanum TaxID=1670608 RepID=A0A9P8I531_9PEZI|nr:hypothetical protein FGG08_004543 [Glutinoglossum americanum]